MFLNVHLSIAEEFRLYYKYDICVTLKDGLKIIVEVVYIGEGEKRLEYEKCSRESINGKCEIVKGEKHD